MVRVDRYRICFVCSGNICRSPTAAIVTRRLVAEAGLAELVDVDSAGLGDWHVGDDADARTLRALGARGYDTAGHCARQFAGADFGERDLVVALDRGHYRALRMLAPTAEDRDKVRLLRSFDPAAADGDLEVPDPYYGRTADFEHVLDLVEAACRGLLDEIRPELARPA
jgi:protein-tyrosine phosphatase